MTLPPPPSRRPSARGIAALVGTLVGASVVAGVATGAVSIAAGTVAEEIGTEIVRVDIAGRVSILFPRGYDTAVQVTNYGGGFEWVSAGGYESWDVRDLEIDNGDDAPASLWSVILRGEPATILGADPDVGNFLPAEPSAAEFLEGARRAADAEFEDGTVIGTWDYDTLVVEETTSADGMPMLVATYTWGLSELEARWAGEGALGWQTVTTYSLDGDTAWRLSATGFRVDELNETLREVAMSIQRVGR